MPKSNVQWEPKFTITPVIAKHLMEIEAAKVAVEHTPLPVSVEAKLRQQARVRSSHYSTYIEGNRLTVNEAGAVIENQKLAIEGKRHDVSEVRNYWAALLFVEECAAKKITLTEELIRKLHAIVEKGKRARQTPYRDGQNVIRNSISGSITYLPPEAADIPPLMSGLAAWVKQAEKDNIPIPLIAALIHYQFVTIHPFYDGNGRTARLLATFILHRRGYGLNGFFSLEEHHAKDLNSYYRALIVHPHHNYYMGRSKADLTGWVEYFTGVLAKVFTEAKNEAIRLSKENIPPEPEQIRSLDRRARIILGLFSGNEEITSADVASALGLSQRTARELIKEWVQQGMLVPETASNKNRRYRLSAIYRQHIGNLSAI
ncbi:MAG: Fic family protein [Dehalococcoidia bacterium]|nr:MAG: Fic family protein [Dehalococcoidia bacterium]